MNRDNNDTASLLSIRHLSSEYTSRNYGLFGKKHIKKVLHDINLDIYPGEIFGLVGESGCGKTTLARCILNLTAYQGDIFLDGKNYASRLERARLVQMVFQDPGASLNPVKKIGWLLEEPLVIHRMGTPEERAALVDETLTRVGLDPSYKKRRVTELSGGQKQRICIGRALILKPKLLIADEAVSALDVSVGAQILNLFRDLHESLGLSVLFISHNMNAVEYLCDRVAVMQDGKLSPPAPV
ncbi:hypothetical protein AGMMS49928_01250 [Spirochaetia bacterium]|nr:hypothetical protein AGMMS49928_01250 [Spirochaetia bacterium]